MLERVPDCDPLRRMGQVHRLLGEEPPHFVGLLDAFSFQGKDAENLVAERGVKKSDIYASLSDGLQVIRHLAARHPAEPDVCAY